MEKWNDHNIRQEIEEIIIESYLRCLTEPEIRDYFKNFLDSCDSVLRKKAGEANAIRFTAIKAALLKGYFLLSGDLRPVPNPARNLHGKILSDKTDLELLTEEIVSVRSSILRLLDDYDPNITKAVQHKIRKKTDARFFPLPGKQCRTIIVSAGCAALIAAAVLLLFFIFFR